MAAAARAVPKRSDPGRGRDAARVPCPGDLPRGRRRRGAALHWSCRPLPAARCAEPPAGVTGPRREEVAAGLPGDFRDPALQERPRAPGRPAGPLRSPLPPFPVSPPEQKAGVSPWRGLPREELGIAQLRVALGVQQPPPRREPVRRWEVTCPRSLRSTGLGTPLPVLATNRLPSPLEEPGEVAETLPSSPNTLLGPGVGGEPCGSRWVGEPAPTPWAGRHLWQEQRLLNAACQPRGVPAAGAGAAWGPGVRCALESGPAGSGERCLEESYSVAGRELPALVQTFGCKMRASLDVTCVIEEVRALTSSPGSCISSEEGLGVHILVSSSGYHWDTSLPWVFFFSLTLGRAHQGDRG